MSKVAALEARESWEAERTGELSKMRWNTGVRRPGSKVSANKKTHTQVSWCWSVLMSAELQTPGPLTWPGAPGNSCSGTAECRKETECPPTSSLPPFPRCSPPPCWQSRPGRSSSLYGSSCEKREGMSREKQRPCQMAVPIFFFFAWQHYVIWKMTFRKKKNTTLWVSSLCLIFQTYSYMKSVVTRWEPLAMALNSTPSRSMSLGRHHSSMFPVTHTQTSVRKHTYTRDVRRQFH